MTDPWLTQKENGHSQVIDKFEDNFSADNVNENTSNNQHTPLPDSENYLRGLERKLEKIKKGSKLVDALHEIREDCMRALLNEQNGSLQSNESLNALDVPIHNTDSTVQELYRHLNPIQPVTVAETVNIVKYDQLERETVESAEEDNPDK